MTWKTVLALDGSGYTPGFDPTATYEFKRVSSDEISTFRMADQNPYFNIANLFWREPVDA